MKLETLRAIIECTDDDLRILAAIAGGHPTSFYRGANFDDADLRGQDLRGFNLQAATFRRARVDRHTLVDPEYRQDVGLERHVKVDISMYNEIRLGLKNCGVTLEKQSAEHLGDILEDALFVKNNVVQWSSLINKTWDISETVRLDSVDVVSMSTTLQSNIASIQSGIDKFDAVTFSNLMQPTLPINENSSLQFFLSQVDDGHQSILDYLKMSEKRPQRETALLARHAGEHLLAQAKHRKKDSSQICMEALISFILTRSPPGNLPRNWERLKNRTSPGDIVATSTGST